VAANVITTPSRAPRGKSKLDQARAKRQTQTTQAVAAAVKPSPVAKPKPAPVRHKPKVKNFVLPVDVISRGTRRIAEYLDRTGRGLSWSGLAEVALLELLDRKDQDFDEAIERHGARARRPDVK
jgi:hypothetical protein